MKSRVRLDAITLAVLHHRLAAIAEEMGVRLGHTGFSPNIKERHDYSCALFDAGGRLVAQAAHIPVHLGSTPLSVHAALAAHRPAPGDVIAVNDPYAGGTHLPDLTSCAGAFPGRLLGSSPIVPIADIEDDPGSTLARDLSGGFVCAGTSRARRRARGRVDPFLANTRVPDERRGDLDAQRGALAVGAERLVALAAELGAPTLARGMSALQGYSERLMAATLRALPRGVYRAEDRLDDDGLRRTAVPIRVAIHLGGGRARVDFTGTAPQVEGSLNANYAITLSAVMYVFTALGREAIPPNYGVMRLLDEHAPAGSVVNADFPAAVAGGNVETSQRIVDVVRRALARAAPDRIPAASCGSMNNLAVGGFDRRRGRAFSYYETVAGGAGAGPHHEAASGIHTHMTNTLNTPIEALEAYYPFLVTEYRLRPGSGGRGLRRGGDGLVREITLLEPADVTLLTERRRFPAWGLAGGGTGRRGRNSLVHKGRRRDLPGKINLRVEAGDTVRLETPGGGGWGKPRGKK
jgi:N-methylhydantoinase B